MLNKRRLFLLLSLLSMNCDARITLKNVSGEVFTVNNVQPSLPWSRLPLAWGGSVRPGCFLDLPRGCSKFTIQRPNNEELEIDVARYRLDPFPNELVEYGVTCDQAGQTLWFTDRYSRAVTEINNNVVQPSTEINNNVVQPSTEINNVVQPMS